MDKAYTNHPKLSIIITTHNGRLDLLKRAVSSVQSQTFTDWELLIVNDGATDGTKEYLDSIASDRVIPIHRTKSFGNDTLPKNRGIKASKGEYIALLDSDNEFTPDHLQALHKAITSSDADVVYGDRMIYYEEKPQTIGVHSNFNPYLLLQRNYIDTSDVLIKRKSLFEVGGFDERYGKYVDWNLWVRMAKAGYKFLRVPLIITNYHIHPQQKSALVHTKGDDENKGLFVPEWSPYELEIWLPYLGAVHKPKVAVFTLVKDRLEYTRDCILSLEKNAGYEYDHYIVNQGSDKATSEWIDKYQHDNLGRVIVVRNEENMGIAVGSNQAISDILKGEYDIVIKYDNDCLSITEGWVKEIVELYKKNAMMCFSPYPEGLRESAGGTPRLQYGKLNGHLLGITNHLGGLCHVAPISVYKQFKWDESQPLHGLQDLELSQWLTKNGYQLAYVEDMRVQHYEGTDGQHKRYPEYFEKRREEHVKVAKPRN